jgi:type I restriction enzyme S subunit
MSRVDDLIAEHCPQGVHYVALEGLFYLRGGYTPSRADAGAWADGTVPWFRMEDLRQSGGILSESAQKVNASAVKGGRLFPADSLLVATSATIGNHALVTVPHLCNQRFTSLSLRPEWRAVVDMRFAYYYGFVLAEWCRANTTTSSFASVDMTGFRQFRFPVPPLPVQREIVRILDSFTELEAALEVELSAELDARRRQYAHYCDSLLDHTTKRAVPCVPLGDLARIVDGTHKTPRYVDSGVPFVSAENIRALGDTKKFVTREDFAAGYKLKPQRGDLLMTRIGSIGECAIVESDAPLAYYVTLALIRPITENLNPRYLRHVIRSSWGRAELRRRTIHTAVPIKINLGDVGKLLIPLLDPDEQCRVADILDSYERVVDELVSRLPEEMVARRQQYEFHRSRLLAFPELVAS